MSPHVKALLPLAAAAVNRGPQPFEFSDPVVKPFNLAPQTEMLPLAAAAVHRGPAAGGVVVGLLCHRRRRPR